MCLGVHHSDVQESLALEILRNKGGGEVKMANKYGKAQNKSKGI